jgi:RNA polymerase sigma factor (sigma-70 family)
MKATATSSRQGVTSAQMREAERGLKLMLGAKFPRVWIAEHAAEVLGQAHVEYQVWLEKNPPARNPIGWLLTCAYRRALNVRDSERRRPSVAPLDAVFHLADESTPTPEQEAIDRDRQKRLHEALSHLPEKEVKLLALVYFEDHSIREAGRKLGWQKSAADRHHATAMAKLRALVGEDRSLFSPATLGLAAYLACKGGQPSRLLNWALRPARELLAIGTELVSSGGRRLGQLARNLSPVSEASAAAANSGAGRAAGVCGAGIITLVCVGAASVVAPALDSSPAPHLPAARQVKGPSRPSATPTPTTTPTELSTPEVPTPPSSTPEPAQRAKASTATAKPLEPRQSEKKRVSAAPAPQATPKQVESNFGIEGGSGSTSEAAPAPAPEAAPESSASRPSASPPPESSKSSSSAATHEFGL